MYDYFIMKTCIQRSNRGHSSMTSSQVFWLLGSSLVTVGPRRHPVYPYNSLLRVWRQGKQLGTEMSLCQLSEGMVHVQLPRKYINIGNKYFLFDSNDS